MNELLAELQEDLRQERLQKLWNNFGKLMVAVSVAVVLITIAVVLWNNHRHTVAMQETAQFISGIDRMGIEDYKGAAEIFTQLAEHGSSSYYGVAMLHKAEAETAGGNSEAAAKTYEALAAHNDVFGALAQLHLTDKLLEPNRASPFYHTLTEWHAWQLVQAGKKEEAVTLFSALRDDDNAPTSLRKRVAEALQHLSPAGAEP